jgi:uncharacterized protein involved in type VI secretion and phage assembly
MASQFEQSDLDFVQALMVEEGLTLYLDETTETETLRLVDSNDGFPKIETMA